MKNLPITEDHLYRKAYDKGLKNPGKYVAVYLLKDFANRRIVKADPLHRPVNRLGITVGKKIGGAVERNRAKRLMRESYRLIEKERELKHGYLVVLAARGRINGAKLPEVMKDIENSFVKLGLTEAVNKEDGQ